MANGDPLPHKIIRATHAHTTSGAEVLASFLVPVGTDALVRCVGWAHVRQTGATTMHEEGRKAVGFVNGGTFTIQAEGGIGAVLDVGTSGYTVTIAENGDTIELRVTAANNARSHGYLEVWMTEQALTA